MKRKGGQKHRKAIIKRTNHSLQANQNSISNKRTKQNPQYI